MKKIVIIMLALFLSGQAKAVEVTKDGFTYKLTDEYTVDMNRVAVLIGCEKTGDIVVPDLIDITESDLPSMSRYLGEPISYLGEYSVLEEDGAFNSNQEITSVVLPKAMYSIRGFNKCYSLHSVVLPDSIKTINGWCFGDTWGLQSLEIPEGVTTIAYEAFYQSGVRNVSLPSTLTTIRNFAFDRCRNLQSIVVPESVTTLESGAFYLCEGMKSAQILCPLQTLPSTIFYDARNLKSVELPNTIETIGENAFNSCGSLTSFVFPENVKVIERGAFGDTGIEVLELPVSLDSIGDQAFASMRRNPGMGGLQLIRVHAVVPPKCAGDMVFTNYDNTDWRTYQEVPLEVPEESIEAYKNAPVWKNFSNICALGATTGVELSTTHAEQQQATDSYTLSGVKTKGQTKGLTLVRESNGSVKKVLVK